MVRVIRWAAAARAAHRRSRRLSASVKRIEPVEKEVITEPDNVGNLDESDDPVEAGDSEPAFLWANFFFDEVKSERDRRASLEQRGLGIISFSGLLIGLLLNASRDVGISNWPTVSATLLLAALTTLVVSALFGLLCALPRSYGGIKYKKMKEILEKYWGEPDFVSSRRIGAVHISMMKTSLELNLVKARYLRLAVGAAALGILLSSSSLMANILSSIL